MDDELTPQDFDEPKVLTEELTECATIVHKLFDNGMSLDEVHEFVDTIFNANMDELAWFVNHNGRMND